MKGLRLCIAAFAMLCGSVSLIYPFGRDQGAYAYAGWVMLEGGAPYRDVFVFKPPMTAVVHGLAIGLFGVNTWAIRVLAKLLQDTTTPDQRVFLWGYEPTINVRARRHTVSRFLYNFPLRVSWGDPEYEAELMQALRARPPDVIVVSSGDRFPGLTSTYKDSAALLRDFEELDVFVKERYEPAETVGRYSLWRLHKRVERLGSPNIILISVDTLRPDHLGAY